jgi:flagellar motility protein MotE (MotC chaperone)
MYSHRFCSYKLRERGIMTNRRTGENKRQEHKNYLARYRRLIKMQKTHYNKWVEVSKEIAELNPHLEKSRHGNG